MMDGDVALASPTSSTSMFPADASRRRISCSTSSAKEEEVGREDAGRNEGPADILRRCRSSSVAAGSQLQECSSSSRDARGRKVSGESEGERVSATRPSGSEASVRTSPATVRLQQHTQHTSPAKAARRRERKEAKWP